MGQFVKGEWIYVMGKITEVNPEDSTRYKVETDLAKFYVTEKGDVLRSNPADVYTASELYAMFIDINKMSAEDVKICFGEDYSDLVDVVAAGFSITELRTAFLEWQLGNTVSIGDMVYFTPEGAENSILCSVIDILEGDVNDTATDNVYTIYSDELDQVFSTTRAQITAAKKRSTKVIQSLSDLKDATKEAREAIG